MSASEQSPVEAEAQQHRSRRRFTDDDVIEALQLAWQIASADAAGLSVARYGELVRNGAVDGPSSARIVQLCGSWQAAIDRAGVPSGGRPTRVYASRWSDEEILAAVRRYLDDPRVADSFAGWDDWRREHAPDAPSGAMLRNRLGPWSTIKQRARER